MRTRALMWVNGGVTPALFAFHKFGEDYNALAFDATFDVACVVRNKGDAAHGSTALGCEPCTFDVEVLDQHNGIASRQRGAVGVFVRGGGGDVIGPRLRFFIQIQLIEQIARPWCVELGQRAGGEDLDGGVFGPHGCGKAAEMRLLGRVQLRDASGAEVSGGIGRPAGNRVGSEGDVGRGAEGACHAGGCRWIWWGMEVGR